MSEVGALPTIVDSSRTLHIPLQIPVLHVLLLSSVRAYHTFTSATNIFVGELVTPPKLYNIDHSVLSMKRGVSHKVFYYFSKFQVKVFIGLIRMCAFQTNKFCLDYTVRFYPQTL